MRYDVRCNERRWTFDELMNGGCDSMRPFQFSLADLCGLVLFVAVASAALVSGSAIWALTMFLIVLILLLVAAVLAVSLDEVRRTFWAAFALCGWGYFMAWAFAYYIDVDVAMNELGIQFPFAPSVAAEHGHTSLHSAIAFVIAYVGGTCARWIRANRVKKNGQ